MIDNRIGKFFPPAIRTIGYISLVVGILLTLDTPLIGLGLALLGTTIVFLKSGVQIDPEKKRLKEYTGLFGLKIGKWKGMEEFTDISILQKRIVSTAISRANRPATTSDEIVYDVCLLNKTHRKQQVVHRLTDKNESIEVACQLAKVLDLKHGPYNPEISAATRDRRRR